ncbi:MAG: 23S rRNA (adenine(2503)-C(2))-methyltransferase RlmN [Bradymonadia bacterium]
MAIRPVVPTHNLTELTREAMVDLMAELGQPKYRAGQLYQWVFQKGANHLDEMTNLPKTLRAALAEAGWTVGRLTVDKVAESSDGTRKVALKTEDGAVIESVLIMMEPGKFTQCLSSQVGCALGCTFCYTATLGLARHLTVGEIVDQVLKARQVLPEGARISHLVYMGMGEPLHNLDGVVESIRRLCDPDGQDFSERRITVSTSGLVPQIARLGGATPVNLAVSLNASDDDTRDRVMPINKRYKIPDLVEALKAYPLPPRRKMTLEYVLLHEVNDSDDDARRLVKIMRQLPNARLNLLQWNPFAGPNYQRPPDERVRRFQRILLNAGIRVTVRMSRGLDIDAACGQLGARPEDEEIDEAAVAVADAAIAAVVADVDRQRPLQ